MNLSERLSLLKLIGSEIKWGVILTDVFMTLYVLWLIVTNQATWWVGVLFGFTPFGALELFRASKLFGLCIFHKLMLIHTVLVYMCCVYQAYYGFGNILAFARWLMLLIGLVLILFLIVKIIKNKGNCFKTLLYG